MKTLLSIVLGFYTLTCCSQDSFADNLKDFAWTADADLNLDQIKKSKTIFLTLLKIPKDSLRTSRTVWTFGDSLTIKHLNSTLKMETGVGKFRYDLEWDKMLLHIRFSKAEKLTYRLIFVSTGNFVSLNRKKAARLP